MNSQPRLLGVVLCGGASTRMGRDKTELITADGRTFLDHACNRLLKQCDQVCVSASQNRATKHLRIPDSEPSFGPISGIDAALCYAEQNGWDACLFNPVDTPLLDNEALGMLVDCYREHRDHIVCATSMTNQDQIEPLIGIYPIAARLAVTAAISRRQFSVQRFLSKQDVLLVPIDSQACRNINTPIEFNSLERPS